MPRCHKIVDKRPAPAYPTRMSDPHHLDARSLRCPLPVLKARKRLMALAKGEELHVLADDPAAIIDIPHFCAEQGHTLLRSEDRGSAQLYVIAKG